MRAGEDRRCAGGRDHRVHACGGTGLWCGREGGVDVDGLQFQKPVRRSQPRPCQQFGPGAEAVVDRAVGDAGGGGDGPDGDRGGAGTRGQVFGGVEDGVEVVDARARHAATITEQVLCYTSLVASGSEADVQVGACGYRGRYAAESCTAIGHAVSCFVPALNVSVGN